LHQPSFGVPEAGKKKRPLAIHNIFFLAVIWRRPGLRT
jgi:hypothetical protein